MTELDITKQKNFLLGGGGFINYVSCKLFLQKIWKCYNKLHPVICTNIGLYNWTRKRSGVENVSVYFSYELNFILSYFLKRITQLNSYISKTKLKSCQI